MTVITDADSPRWLLDSVRSMRTVAADAERGILIAAAEWADAHPVLEPGDGSWEEDECQKIPDVPWSAVPEFAAALRMSTSAGSRVIKEALEARHRLPQCWQQLKSGNVEAWRLRMIAGRTLLESDDVVAEIDQHIAPVVGRLGSIKLDKLITEVLMRLHPAEWERRQHNLLDRRYVRLFDQITHNGVAQMQICADLADLLGFDQAVAVVAARLAELGDTDSLDVRRSKAVGILADPEAAIALLTKPADGPDTQANTKPPATTRPAREVVLHVHLSDAAVAGADTVGRLERGDQPITEKMIRDWCGRTDTNLKVYPVRDLEEHEGVSQYELPDRLKKRIEESTHTCVFAWCTRPARRCDKDHRVPYDDGGASCNCNVAPLCRRHHRVKTRTAWRYELVDLGTYLWTSPFGQ